MGWLDWMLLLARIVLTFFMLLFALVIVIWLERKFIADMQTRPGPLRAGPRGVLITLADGMKLFFKESFVPTLADRPVYLIAPILAVVPAFLAFSVIPWGTHVTLFGREIPFQIADLNIGILWVLAMTSMTVYAVVLAGWSSGSNYPLLGSVRSSAQMISYEVGMGLALISVLMFTGHLKMSEIVAGQGGYYWGFVPRWNFIPQFPAFLLYLIAGLAETNRPPFDLPEAESELVAGFHTEYSGWRFAMLYLGEYLNTITVAAIATTLFLGGWRGPHPSFLPWLWPIAWFALKILVIFYVYVWIRGTMPRIRYDRLMAFGWKLLIPLGLFWVLATGTIVLLPGLYGSRGRLVAVGLIVGIGMLLLLAADVLERPRSRSREGASP